MESELIEIEVEQDLYDEVSAICKEMGTTPEELAVQFIEWTVRCPEDAKRFLLSEVESAQGSQP